MQEIEAKILEIDRAQIELRLAEAGAVLSFDHELSARFYDLPDGSITRAGGVLRLRREGSQTVLTHKALVSLGAAKVMEETETGVADAHQMDRLLRALGYQVIKSTRKRRTQYDLGDVHIALDAYADELAYIPLFLEIEAPSLDRLHAAAAQLGYSPADCRDWNTYDLIRHYGSSE
ncbi:MAG: class IV adenylate cyclase [Bacteroidia bacterium]|nr:class IV adenylate cyclase [Bacteroidia bacterium]